MRKRGQELTKYGHERRGNTRHREHRSDSMFAAACFVCIFHEWLSGCFRIALLLCDDCMYVCRCLFCVYFPWVTLGVFQNRFTSLWWLHVCLQMLVLCVFSMSDSRVFQNRFTSLWWLHVCLQMLVLCVFSMSDSRGVSESLYFSVMTACMFADACFVCIFHEWLSGCFRIALLLCDDCMYVCRCLFCVYFPWVTLGCFRIALLLCDDCMYVCRCLFCAALIPGTTAWIMNGCIQENDLPWFCTDGFDISMKINQNKKWHFNILFKQRC